MTMHALHDAQQDAGHDAEHGGTWATLAEAASVLGCSVDTVRRRIRRGELHAMQDAGRHGPTWRVLLSATPSSMPTVGGMPSVDDATPSVTPSVEEDNSALLEALRMLDAMRQENRDLAGQVGYLQARTQMLDERVRALEAPKPEPAPDPFPAPLPPTPNAAPWDARWQARVTIAAAVLAVLALATVAPTWLR